MTTWWCLRHVPYEGPGGLAGAVAAQGHRLEVVDVAAGDPLPDAAALRDRGDVLLVMGGPMGALDDDAHPWLAAERALVADCVARDVPVLGVCLGAQLVAAALGAAVYRAPSGEVGAGTVALTDAGRDDPVLQGSPDPLPVLHWHHDTFDLPDGAVLLASSDRCAHQAFRVGRAYGLQFHVELGPADLPTLQEHMNPARVPSAAELAAVAAAGRPVMAALVRALSSAPH